MKPKTLKEFFNSSKRWMQHEYGITYAGESVGPDDMMTIHDLDIRCACLLGAVYYCCNDPETVLNQIRQKINNSIVAWNDASERTFADIQKLVNDLEI